MFHVRSPKSALVASLLVAACAAPALAGASLDIRPSTCPNLVERHARPLLALALVSDADFVVPRVDIDHATLELSRTDGVGGAIAPLVVFPASLMTDVAAPSVSGMCSTFGVDGIPDLRMLFSRANLFRQLELGSLPPNASIELCLSGQTGDGTPFNVCDIAIVTSVARIDGPGDLGSLPRRR